MKDIESVLIMNRLPARGCENRNLSKFFGKGKSIRAPSKEVFLAMKRAVESNSLKSKKDTVARMTAAAERKKIHEQVERLVQEKKEKPDVASSSPSTSRGLLKTVKPVYAKGSGFNHAMKLHIASLFYHQVISYESEETSEEDDLKLEAEVSEECIRLLELPGMVKAFNINVDNLEAPPLIFKVYRLREHYQYFRLNLFCKELFFTQIISI